MLTLTDILRMLIKKTAPGAFAALAVLEAGQQFGSGEHGENSAGLHRHQRHRILDRALLA